MDTSEIYIKMYKAAEAIQGFCPIDLQKYFCSFKSMEQRWLALVMYEKYELKWNGEAWIKQ